MFKFLQRRLFALDATLEKKLHSMACKGGHCVGEKILWFAYVRLKPKGHEFKVPVDTPFQILAAAVVLLANRVAELELKLSARESIAPPNPD